MNVLLTYRIVTTPGGPQVQEVGGADGEFFLKATIGSIFATGLTQNPML